MIRLISLGVEMREALGSEESFEAEYGVRPREQLELLRQVVEQTLAFQESIGAAPPWVGYAVVRDDEVVGSCGFKGNPDLQGAVEIAYFTFPSFEHQGLATEMARELVTIARGSGAVRQVLAHTLPEPNASTRILERTGFRFTGEVEDPEDGTVWRWVLEI